MKIKYLSASILTASLAGGCANMPDQQRTQTEGAAAGAVLGGLIGYAVNREQGAAIGALLGGGVGFAVGNEVAKRKQAYATNEDFLNGQIARMDEFNRTSVAYNKKLRTEIASLDRESKTLQSRYKAGKVRQDALIAKRNQLNTQIANNKKLDQTLSEEQKVQTQIIAEQRQTRPANDPYIKRLEKENRLLQQNIDTLRDGNTQLARIDQRLSV